MPSLNAISIVLSVVLLTTLVSVAHADRSILVSVTDQKLLLMENGLGVARFPVSTSRFGLGDRPRSFATPLGTLAVASKIGGGFPPGAVFKGGRPTGEILRPNSPGRDPIVTRILCLRGLDSSNERALCRGIFIHGTPVERLIGRPASFGCIRMRSRDVMALFERVAVGTKVEIVNTSLNQALQGVSANRQGG